MTREKEIVRQLIGLPGGIRTIIDLRAEYRNKGDYKHADRIRDDLKSAGIGILDEESGSDWRFLK